jgi:TPR repeat protein
MMLLGAMYEDGAGGLPKDAAAALDWYKKAADLGNSYGQEQVKRLQGASH